MFKRSLPAIILASGDSTDKVAASQGKSVKALCTVRGEPLIIYVIDALEATGLAPILAVTSPLAIHEMERVVPDNVTVLAADGTRFSDTVKTGLSAVGDARRVLFVTGDLPALTAEAVRHFLDEAFATDAGLVYSTVRADILSGPIAKGKRVRIKLREGKFVGGNLVLASPDVVRRAMALVEQAFAARKSAIGLARLFGLSFIIRLALGWLDIPAIVRRAEQLLECKASVVICPFPGICFDMDTPEDLALAEEVLSSGDT